MIPHSYARLRENQNKPIGRTFLPGMGKGAVATNFDLYMYGNGIHAVQASRAFDVLITDVSALSGTLYRLEVEIEILANPVLGTSAHSQNLLLASNISKSFMESEISNYGYARLQGAEYQINTLHKQKLFEARRIRVQFYNKDSGSPVLEETSDFSEYFCYSPVVGIANTINASINYQTPNHTVFDTNSFSQTAKIVTRFDNFAFTGDSENLSFKLAFNAASTSATPTKVFYEESILFNPNNGVPYLEIELLQPDAIPRSIMENYSVNDHDVDLIPAAWPSVVKKELGYGWDSSWNSPVSVSPSVITTFDISYADIVLAQGISGTTNQWKEFAIIMNTLTATNIANVGYNISSNNSITAFRSGITQPQYYIAAMGHILDPAVATPATLHTNVLRTYGAVTDIIRGPCLANVDVDWFYTGKGVLSHEWPSDRVVVPPYFNTISLAVQNFTQTGYDIVVTAFDGFTAFNQNGASGETPYYEILIDIWDATLATNQPPVFSASGIQFTGSTLPFTIKTVSRAAGSPDLSWFPASFSGSHEISVYVKYTVATSGFTQTVYNYPAGPFTMYSGHRVLSTGTLTNQSLPSYTSSSVSLLNQTNVSFDIELTTLVADPAVTYDIEFEVVRPNNNPNSLPEKAAAIVQVAGNTSNHTIYQADRLLQDTDWWRGDPNSHTFDVVVRVKYGTHVFNTHTVQTQSFPQALIWRFKGNSSCLSDIDGHGLTWVVNNTNTTITYNANDIELTGAGSNHDLRLYNTGNGIDDACMNIGLFRNATFGVRAHPVVTSASSIFQIMGKDPAPNTSGYPGNWSSRLYNIQLYGNNYTAGGFRTSGLFQSSGGSNPSYQAGDVIQHGWSYGFLYNKAQTYTSSDFNFMRTYETGVTGNVRAPGITNRFASSNSTDSYFQKHSGGGGGTLNTPLNFTAGVISHIYNNDNEGVGMCGGTHLVDPNGVTRSHSSFGTTTGYNGVTSGTQDANYIECVFYNSGGKLEGIYLYPH